MSEFRISVLPDDDLISNFSSACAITEEEEQMLVRSAIRDLCQSCRLSLMKNFLAHAVFSGGGDPYLAAKVMINCIDRVIGSELNGKSANITQKRSAIVDELGMVDLYGDYVACVDNLSPDNISALRHGWINFINGHKKDT